MLPKIGRLPVFEGELTSMGPTVLAGLQMGVVRVFFFSLSYLLSFSCSV